MNTSDWSEFFQKMLSVILGGVGTWIAVRSYYEKRHKETMDRNTVSVQKAYAAERDFEHLRKNQEQIKEAIKLLDDELTETREDFKELKGMLMVFFGKAGESVSGIFGYRKKE